MKTLPQYIELRRRGVGRWRMLCRACGTAEDYASFWPASEAAHEHAGWHQAEEDPAP
jgi:hypothetical protein